jgi:hypothetical protein
VSVFEFPIAAETEQVFQAILPVAAFRPREYRYFPLRDCMEQVCREIPPYSDIDCRVNAFRDLGRLCRGHSCPMGLCHCTQRGQ